MKKTPLYDAHVQHNGRIIDFSGWALPVQYSGTLKEHTAVRERAGIFDVSHMGQFDVRGPDAESFLQGITVNDVQKLVDGKAQYSMLLNDRGGIIDDIIVYRFVEDHFMLVVNAANIDTDWHWVMAHQDGDVTVKNISDTIALLALQGPNAAAILQTLTKTDLPSIKRFHFAEGVVAEVPVTMARTGYTGEDGFEIFVPAAQGMKVWNALVQAGEPHGLLPCGLAARDTLRLEMAYPLHGHDISPKHTPFEANLRWVVKMNKGDFIGRSVLAQQDTTGVPRCLVGFRMLDRGIAREGYPIVVAHKPVGYVTSGTMSPSLKVGIGMGYVPCEHQDIGTKFSIDIRGEERVAQVVKTPFYSTT